MDEEIVQWEAEEYIRRDKNVGWYFGLAGVGIALVALSIWLRWWSFTGLIVVSIITLISYSLRPPRKINYKISRQGLSEGEKIYRFEDFKSFGILQDDTNFAIVMTPRKRFLPAVTVYFPKEKGEKIVDMFGARLPMETVKLDIVDKIVRKLRI